VENCIFCKHVINNPDSLTIYKDDEVVVFLDKFPRTKGHLLVAPAKHEADFHAIPPDTRTKIFEKVSLFCDILKTYGAKGINLGSNIGAMAGQQVPHFHIHVIPRYEKDDAIEIEPAFVNTPWRQKSLTLSNEEMNAICSDLKQLYQEQNQ